MHRQVTYRSRAMAGVRGSASRAVQLLSRWHSSNWTERGTEEPDVCNDSSRLASASILLPIRFARSLNNAPHAVRLGDTLCVQVPTVNDSFINVSSAVRLLLCRIESFTD